MDDANCLETELYLSCLWLLWAALASSWNVNCTLANSSLTCASTVMVLTRHFSAGRLGHLKNSLQAAVCSLLCSRRRYLRLAADCYCRNYYCTTDGDWWSEWLWQRQRSWCCTATGWQSLLCDWPTGGVHRSAIYRQRSTTAAHLTGHAIWSWRRRNTWLRYGVVVVLQLFRCRCDWHCRNNIALPLRR